LTRAKFCSDTNTNSQSLQEQYTSLDIPVAITLYTVFVTNVNYFYYREILKTYISNLKVLSHEHVERSTSVGSDICEYRAAVTQQSQAEVSTLLGVFLKQQLRKLQHIHQSPTTTVM